MVLVNHDPTIAAGEQEIIRMIDGRIRLRTINVTLFYCVIRGFWRRPLRTG